MSMEQICAYFGITRQAHYQMMKREQQRAKEELLILEMVRQVRRKHPRMGVRKLYVKIGPMLEAEELKIGRDGLFELLGRADMLVQRRRKQRRTTIPGVWRTPNLLPGLTVMRPNQVWVSDITYLETEVQPFVYLFVIMDLYSRYIVGWHVSVSLAASGALLALNQAIQQCQSPIQNLIHHSDHGVQYTCHDYLDTLSNHNIRPSMGAVGNCYENAFAERVIGTIKGEYGLDRRLADLLVAHELAEEAILLYNTDRPHQALSYAYPSQVYYQSVCNSPSVSIPLFKESFNIPVYECVSRL
jgi:transposase InsO family protein